jgi:hypothetical protein
MNTFYGRLPNGSREVPPAEVVSDMLDAAAGEDEELLTLVTKAARQVFGDTVVDEILRHRPS